MNSVLSWYNFKLDIEEVEKIANSLLTIARMFKAFYGQVSMRLVSKLEPFHICSRFCSVQPMLMAFSCSH